MTDLFFHCFYFPGGRHGRRSFFKITTACPAEGELEVVKENFLDRLFKAIGFSRELTTGDPRFDQQFYILTDFEPFATAFLQDGEKRRAIEEIFKRGFRRIKLDGKELTAVQTPARIRDEHHPAVTEVKQQLAKLLKNIPQTGILPASQAARKKGIGKQLVVLPPVLFFLGIALFLVGNHFYPMLDGIPLESWRVFVPGLVGYLLINFFLLRGRSRAHRAFAYILLFSLAAFPLLGIGLHTTLNGLLGRGAPTGHTAKVVRTEVRGGRSKTYYVYVASWRHRGTEQIRVRVKHFYALTPGFSYLTIRTRPGFFGKEWMVSYRLAVPPS